MKNYDLLWKKIFINNLYKVYTINWLNDWLNFTTISLTPAPLFPSPLQTCTPIVPTHTNSPFPSTLFTPTPAHPLCLPIIHSLTSPCPHSQLTNHSNNPPPTPHPCFPTPGRWPQSPQASSLTPTTPGGRLRLTCPCLPLPSNTHLLLLPQMLFSHHDPSRNPHPHPIPYLSLVFHTDVTHGTCPSTTSHCSKSVNIWQRIAFVRHISELGFTFCWRHTYLHHLGTHLTVSKSMQHSKQLNSWREQLSCSLSIQAKNEWC